MTHPTPDSSSLLRRARLSHLFAMQSRMNRTVNTQWFTAGYRWTRAIMLEGAELIEHYNRWKWWKKNTTPDLAQVRLELVDIFHFALSEWMVRFGTEEASSEVLLDATMRRIEQGLSESARLVPSDEAFNRQAEALIAAGANGIFEHRAFFALCAFSGLDFEALYRLYIGKNMLNMFRQQHGYKTGRYAKLWSGREDNVVLDELFAALPAQLSGEALEQALMAALSGAYRSACEAEDLHCMDTEHGPLVGSLRHEGSQRVLKTADGVYHDTLGRQLVRLPVREH